MSDLTPIEPEMTSEQAQELDAQIRRHSGMTRICVYLMWKHEGFKKLHFKTFDEYCDQRLDTARGTVYGWISQVESTIDAMNLQIEKLSHSETTFADVKLLPRHTTDEIHKLPTPELRQQAYEQIQKIRQDGAHSADYQQCVKIIVSQLLEANTPKQIPAPPAPMQGTHAPGVNLPETVKHPLPPVTLPTRSPFSSPPSAERAPSAPTSAPSPTTLGRSSVPLPTNVPLGKTVTRQPIASFTPPPDEEPSYTISQDIDFDFSTEPPECPDAEEVEICFDTALAWAKSGKIEDGARIRQRTLATICAFMEWAQAQP